MQRQSWLSRRAILKVLASSSVLGPLRRCAWAIAPLEPTPELPDPDEPTPELTAGPFYKPNSPLRAKLVDDHAKGKKLVVVGRVLDTTGRPVPRALLDFWHCDENGAYDNVGFRFRGHQFADDKARFKLETLYPGLYPGRTRHIHVRVQPPNGRILTTQLYFPGEPGNARDPLFRKSCLLELKETRDAVEASFAFVLSPSDAAPSSSR